MKCLQTRCLSNKISQIAVPGKRSSYQLLKSFEKDNLQDMYSAEGFVNGREYRFVSEEDGTVIELVGNKLISKAPVPSSNRERLKFQTFKCTETEFGYFQISCKYQQNESIVNVWDYPPHGSKLVQKKRSRAARNNQNWITKVIPSVSDTVHYVLSCPGETHCLMNTGLDNQLEVVEKSPDMASQKACMWQLECID